MIHDPMRGQMRALLVGVVIAVLISGAAGVLAFMKPSPNFGQSSIMLNKSNGELLVRIGDRLHPALNLASARLIVGKNDPPGEVDAKFLNTVALGPTVGIVGAPSGIYGGDQSSTAWMVCDETRFPSATGDDGAPSTRTTVLANDSYLDGGIQVASPHQAVLATAGGSTYLIYDGVRARIDPANPVLVAALRLDGGETRRVSPGLLQSFPEVDPIVPVAIPEAGAQTDYLPASYRVGSILHTSDSRGEQLFVVLPDGLQPISAPTADIIRYGNPQAATASEPTSISPALVGRAPIVHRIPVDSYPITSPDLVRSESNPMVCMSWQRAVDESASTSRLVVGTHLPLPAAASPVDLATSDGAGPGLDGVYLKPGTGEYVQSVGGGPADRPVGQLFYINDLGVRYHVGDSSAAAALGLGADPPKPAPWTVLSLLPPGPELSQQAALMAHDGIPADIRGVALPVPRN
ncbi:hypothetical protein MARA_01770 (plasmid) [Mycolicibacterium arabiense]|uniref:Type VII secretion protein EccB n=2 Tax=Mycolicibacterium arabiense TaxID=1286181 RepID=A0A7I7RQE1_9MYCO|nr:hypothetical protein MARA_01770 [Mycolicibacterium arabiense]